MMNNLASLSGFNTIYWILGRCVVYCLGHAVANCDTKNTTDIFYIGPFKQRLCI